MTQYTVTIESQPGESTTILRVETTPRPRIVEVTVRAGADGVVCSTALPPVDLAKIADAFGGPGAAEPTAPPQAGGPAQLTAAPGAAGPGQSTRGRQDPSPPPGAADERTTRNYRRMPEVAGLVRAYREAVSVTELARRYGVPRHTMNAWLGRLRREGVIERR
ncbi:hypothetical protein [Micromonospora sp. DT233]|uniref:hypothetical protein n=1 Tax=Micromonospora sp. DT233 TaxID=3393432 RepID=UPI003CF57B59